MTKLRVLVSTGTAYPPNTPCTVNGPPVRVKTETFDGEISVFIKDCDGGGGGGGDGGAPCNGAQGAAFFKTRPELTYAIVVRGRYLDGVGGDDLVFGNVFERPIRGSLPWAATVATKFMRFVDPTLEVDPQADKPWALAPVLATMNRLSLAKDPLPPCPNGPASSTHLAAAAPLAPPAPSAPLVTVDEHALHILDQGGSGTRDVPARRKFFASPANRRRIMFDRDLQADMEFGSGVLNLSTLSVTLPPPFRLSVSLLSYWDGQPAIYVCRRRRSDPVTPEGMYWSVGFEIVDDEAIAALRKRGRSPLPLKVTADCKPDSDTESDSEDSEDQGDQVEISEDVD
ncbi:hypothetical protein CspeluHIS016_0104980 [Cutaneotrichosporon spelunceum]|uniref:Domain of unknown function at the cortex 1 domain-containing protein n=1 Tax=Cutaneotrichosporon spelunceum TaxID=1672016 RepID=A0AAD3TNN4_9TREE|nr:hypothetical protein CspeluHIS016_0104980 [Cutaneotrichosporon spelunceum]